MKLPETFLFLRPGWWAVHVVTGLALFGGGIALGIFHATGHGGHAAHAAHADPSAHQHGPPPPPVTGNPLRDEMIDLQKAFDVLNAGVVLGRTAGIEEAFHAVHARREATVEALRAGTVRPPLHGDQLDAFVERDDAFHALVEATVEAARRDDLPALRAKAGELLDACVACHAEFRGPTP